MLMRKSMCQQNSKQYYVKHLCNDFKLCIPYDGAIAQHFNGDDQILPTDGREILNHWCKVNNSTPLNHSSIISDKMLNEI